LAARLKNPATATLALLLFVPMDVPVAASAAHGLPSVARAVGEGGVTGVVEGGPVGSTAACRRLVSMTAGSGDAVPACGDGAARLD